LDELYVRSDPAKATPRVLYYQEAIQAPGVVTAKSITNNLIVSRGSVQAETIVQGSVIFANGDVTSQGMLSSVIVCDGDVRATHDTIVQTLIVARGSIIVKGAARGANLIAGGKVILGDAREPKNDAHYNVIKENESKPLGFITFFELSTAGLEVKAADKVVQVSAIAKDKPCEKAGLKVGDTILEVNGKKPDSAESLRRLLRDALAVGDASVKLKRGNDALTVKLSLPE
jgi:S1-C subfamily serine protease